MEVTLEDIVITAASPMFALERLIADAVTTPDAPQDPENRYLLGFNVDAPDLTTLIMNAVGEIQALAAEQAAMVVDCEVSGFQETGTGHRLWGTIECTSAVGKVNEATRVDHVMLESIGPGQWQLTARRKKKDMS